MERRYILNAIDAALQAGEKILSIYDDPASDFQVEKNETRGYISNISTSTLERRTNKIGGIK